MLLSPRDTSPQTRVMLHVQRQHVAQKGSGRLVQKYAKTSTDCICWGLNPCLRCVELGTHYPLRRKAPVEVPFNIPVIRARWAARQQMNTLYKRGFPTRSSSTISPIGRDVCHGCGVAQATNINAKRRCADNERRKLLAPALPAPAPVLPRRLLRRRG